MPLSTLLIALVAAALMGFANQRGSVCTVAAVEQIVHTRRADRMIGLVEASLWVAAGFVLLSAAGQLRMIPPDYGLGATTVAGGVLFGLGAFVNGACLFGTVARLGSGQWAYAGTLAGLVLGGFAAGRWRGPQETHASSLVIEASASASAAAVTVALVLVVLRICTHGVEIRRTGRRLSAHLSTPPVATTFIALAFLVVFVTAGPWSYEEALRALGRRDLAGWLPATLLAAALFAGAILGGWLSGELRLVAPDRRLVLRCLAGGVLMSAGATLVPGGNTSLVLLGMPLLWPYAWVAFASLAVTIYLATLVLTLGAGKGGRGRD